MKPILRGLLVLFALHSPVLADVPKTVFDDDWKPPASKEAPHPSSSPVNSATNETPAPPQPVPTPPPEPSRAKVPSLAAQASAWRAIKEDIYKNDIEDATTPTQKVELARKLMNVAEETRSDKVGKYVLLSHFSQLLTRWKA